MLFQRDFQPNIRGENLRFVKRGIDDDDFALPFAASSNVDEKFSWYFQDIRGIFKELSFYLIKIIQNKMASQLKHLLIIKKELKNLNLKYSAIYILKVELLTGQHE